MARPPARSDAWRPAAADWLTAAATAVATMAAIAHPCSGAIVLPLAALVSYSRVALRVHHTTDVLAGMILGAGGALVAATLL